MWYAIISTFFLLVCLVATSEEVIRLAGMKRLQDIVTTREREMALHILRL